MISNLVINSFDEFGKGFIDYALVKRDFGTMNKTDYEVLIFYLLQREMSSMSDFEISRALCIPTSKVSKLRYDADLRYGKREMTNEELKSKAREIILSAKIDGSSKKVVFSVGDQFLRQFIDDLLKKSGYFSDTSFNRELVCVSTRVYAELLELICLTKDDIKKLNDCAKSAIREDASEIISWKTLFVHMADETAKQVGKNTANAIFANLTSVSNVVDWLCENLFKR